MYEKQTQEVILSRMLSRVSNKLDKRESSLIWDTHSSTAIELQNLYVELDTMIANSYGDTAAREFLIRLCKDRGIEVYPATHAVLKGVFTPTDVDVLGKRFNIDKMNYTVIRRIGAGEYEVQCETAGIEGNQYLGTMIPMEYIARLETAELVELLIPGEDEEETEALRKRYYDSLNTQAFGGNRADYLAKVRGMDGVGDVKVTRVWNADLRPADMIPGEDVTSWYRSVIAGLGPETAKWLETVFQAAAEKKLTVGGTVLITIVDSDDYGVCSDTLVDAVQTALDPEQNAGEGYGLAPIGHVVNVKSAVGVAVLVTTTLTFADGYGWGNLREEVENAVSAYLLELRKSWAESSGLIVRAAKVEAEILGIQGIVDIADTRLNGEVGNLALGEYEIPVLGGVGA